MLVDNDGNGVGLGYYCTLCKGGGCPWPTHVPYYMRYPDDPRRERSLMVFEREVFEAFDERNAKPKGG
jgi:hypothetical protein